MEKEEQFQKKAEELTTRVENNESVSDELNKMPFEDRVKMARAMDEINQTHRDADPNLPDIQLTIEQDSGDRDHLTDMKAVTPGRFIDSSTDVYDLPESAQTRWTDYVLDTRLTRDNEDSKHLRSAGDHYEGAGKRNPR